MRRSAALLGLSLITAAHLPAQFAPGGREIYSLNLTGLAPGSVPKGLTLLQGSVVAAVQDGRVMLKAATISEFVLDLPEKLLESFTLQFEIIPKRCCPNPDLSFAGTSGKGGSSSSAEIEWYRDHVTVTGGALQPFTGTIPPRISEVVPGALTMIDVSFEGETIKLYTNGVRIFTLTERRFARGKVLRVLLGGPNGEDDAVYLAGLRVATGPPVLAQQPPPPPAPLSVVLMPPPPPPGGTAMVTPAPAASPAPAPVPLVLVPAAPTTGTATPINPNPTITAPAAGTSTAPIAGRTGATDTRTSLFAPPAPRTITVAGFNAAGPNLLVPPRSLATTGFTAAGISTVVAPRSIATVGFTAAGPPPRTIRGTVPPPPPLPARTIATPGFSAAGATRTVLPRTISTPGFAAKGATTVVEPRILKTAGWTSAGTKTP